MSVSQDFDVEKFMRAYIATLSLSRSTLIRPWRALSQSSATPLALALGATAFSCRSHAIDPEKILILRKDPALFRLKLDLSETLNDNIFYRSTKADSDLITTLAPGFNFLVGRESGNHASLSYSFSQLFYADHTELDTQQHALTLNTWFDWPRLRWEGYDSVQFLSSVLTGGGWLFRETETSTQTPGDLGGFERTLIGEQNIDYISYSDSHGLTYPLSLKTALYLRGSYYATDYEKGLSLFDVNTLRGTGGFAWQTTPKLALFGETYYGQTASNPDFQATKPPHYSFVGLFAGARGQFTPKLTGLVKAGFELGEFSNGTSGPASPVVETSLLQQFTPKTSVSLSYSRRSSVSVQYGGQAYIADSVALNLQQRIGSSGKLSGSIGASFTTIDYSNSTISTSPYNYYGASAALNYRLRLWLNTSLSYDWQSFMSDTPGVIEYDVNRVVLRLSIGY